jgi:hypothetical protein
LEFVLWGSVIADSTPEWKVFSTLQKGVPIVGTTPPLSTGRLLVENLSQRSKLQGIKPVEIKHAMAAYGRIRPIAKGNYRPNADIQSLILQDIFGK